MRGAAAITVLAIACGAPATVAAQDAQADAAGPASGTATPQPAQAPQGDLSNAIVTVDQEVMYRQSAWGRRAEATVADRLRAVVEENDRLFAQLSAEEAALTEDRRTLPPDEFRARAAAFDERVTAMRRQREAASQQVAALAEAERAAFFAAAIPVIGALMRERGALLVLDPRTVLMSAESIDMTEATIARLDDQIGDGAGRVALPPLQAPAEEGADDGTADAADPALAPTADAVAPDSAQAASPATGN
ncbi:OmpH family outer membrane protein [uncultured Paracoccus sp.]|uniref:OmpH family outer membrane protein n=1 Tax=uncultured Paracoccus sp. TaxID=189685 RepID=UPI00260DA791|nr:OmpH family outer membrane protein [uncultured Paracoccus sp.]